MKSVRPVTHLYLTLSFLLLLSGALTAQTLPKQIKVIDAAGAPIAGAKLSLTSAHGTTWLESATAADGVLMLPPLPAGSYVLTIAASGFQPQQISLTIQRNDSTSTVITLTPAALRQEITVTTQRGAVEDARTAAMIVTAQDQSAFRQRPLPTIGNALAGAPNVLVQQSSYAQVSPFLRGLTGYQVLNLIDGVRFNNATFRSGPNQYLAFIEPSQAQRIEALLGPAGVQYGSDALGGTINVLTETPAFSTARKPAFTGELQSFGASADLSGGGNLKLTVGAPKLAALFGGSWRRHNDLRAGRGVDSHHVLRRFFGLTDEQLRQARGGRQQDTGFTQYGWHTKLAARLSEKQNLSLWYQRGVQERVRGYKDLWGGLGRVRSEFAPQELHFLYARYEKLRLGRLNSLTGTFSINTQRDGTSRQNLRTTDRLTTDDNVVNAFGHAAQAATHFSRRQALVFGGEFYRELLRASRVESDPLTNSSTQRRALYPNGSRYHTLGLFAQYRAEWGRLRTSAGARFTRVSFQTFAARNRTATGASLGVTDERAAFRDATYNASLSWRVNQFINVHALVGRGFRAPNLNDLGALGLNDLGYEIPASAAAEFNALL